MGFGKFLKKGISSVTDAVGLTDSEAPDRAIQAQQHAANQANNTQRYIFDQTRKDQAGYRNLGEIALRNLQSGLKSDNRSFLETDFNEDAGRFSKAYNPYRDHNGIFTGEDFEKDPGYQFRLAEGEKAIRRGASADGGAGGGKTLKALLRYGQNFASNEFNNAYNRFNNDYQNSYARYNQDYMNSYNRYNNNKNSRFNRLSSLAGIGQSSNNTIAGVGVNSGNQISNNQIGLGNAIASAELNRGNDLKDLWRAAVKGGTAAMTGGAG